MVKDFCFRFERETLWEDLFFVSFAQILRKMRALFQRTVLFWFYR
jgi:hypothetical protein